MKLVSTEVHDKLARVLLIRGTRFLSMEAKVSEQAIVDALSEKEIADEDAKKITTWVTEFVKDETRPSAHAPRAT
jgi:hypothetical protein